jgi:hypothetical protein
MGRVVTTSETEPARTSDVHGDDKGASAPRRGGGWDAGNEAGSCVEKGWRQDRLALSPLKNVVKWIDARTRSRSTVVEVGRRCREGVASRRGWDAYHSCLVQ